MNTTKLVCPDCETTMYIPESYGRWHCRNCGRLLRDNESVVPEGMYQ
jgi:ribosomal protein L37AE/L43A